MFERKHEADAMSTPVRNLHTWSRSEYERVVESGGFAPDSRVELLDGEIVDMSPQKSAHATAVGLVEAALRGCFVEACHVRAQKPFALDDRSEPEPDVAVVRGLLRDYADAHPSSALLIVEVADSSLAFDRGNKATAYARNGIAEYWVLNLREQVLEVHRMPESMGYRERQVLERRDKIAPLAAETCGIAVADLLP